MRRVLANVVALGALMSCSVYDASLLSNGELVADDGGGSPVVAGAGAGGSGGKMAASSSGMGGVLHGAGTAGREPNAGAAGLGTSAGNTGIDDSAGAAGSADASGGSGGIPSGAGGAPATGGTGGSGAIGGSAAGAAGAPAQELAVGKPATASSIQPGNVVARGNDNNPSTRWCAIDQSMPQWWRVDLGAVHQLQQVSIQFEHPDRKYTYLIESSQDDKVYTQQLTASGTGAVQTLAFPVTASGRYVRITVTAGGPSVTTGQTAWASFFELSLKGI